MTSDPSPSLITVEEMKQALDDAFYRENLKPCERLVRRLTDLLQSGEVALLSRAELNKLKGRQ